MHVQRKVLHLSLLLAMALTPFALSAASSEVAMPAVDSEEHSGEQLAAGKGEAQKFKNAGESSRLRHRVNEAEKDQAERQRLEKHEDGSGTGESPDQEQSKDQDGVKDQTRIQDQDNLKDQSQTQDQDRIRNPKREEDASHSNTMASSSEQAAESNSQFDPYAFEDRSARQSFSPDGSMYQSMGSGSAMGGSSTSTGSSSASGARHGAGGR